MESQGLMALNDAARWLTGLPGETLEQLDARLNQARQTYHAKCRELFVAADKAARKAGAPANWFEPKLKQIRGDDEPYPEILKLREVIAHRALFELRRQQEETELARFDEAMVHLIKDGIEGQAEFWGLPKGRDHSIRIDPADLKRLCPDFGGSNSLVYGNSDQQIWTFVEIDIASIRGLRSRESNAPVAKAKKDRPTSRKRGAKPKHDWPKLDEIASKVLRYHGVPSRDDDDLSSKAALIREVIAQSGLQLDETSSTLRGRASVWIESFKRQKENC